MEVVHRSFRPEQWGFYRRPISTFLSCFAPSLAELYFISGLPQGGCQMDMQRPVMNPTFYDDSPKGAPKVRFKLLRKLAAPGWRALRFVFMLFTYDPFTRIAGF